MLVSFSTYNSYGGSYCGIKITKNGTAIYASTGENVSNEHVFDYISATGRGGSYLLDVVSGDVVSILSSATLNGTGGVGYAMMNIKIS